MNKKTIKKKSEPIKNKKEIEKIEQYLKKRNQRDYTIWVLGMNSGLRVSDIVCLNVFDVVNQTHISIIEKKTGKQKTFYINDKLKKTLNEWTQNRNLDEPLFLGKQGKRLDRSQVYRFIKKACKENKVNIHAGTHTLRRSFGYHHYQKFKDSVVLQKIFNHSHQRITLMYIGIEQDEIDFSYKIFEL